MSSMPALKNVFKKRFDFDGKQYRFLAGRHNKDGAQRLVNKMRSRGFSARMLPFDRIDNVGPWGVYIRKST